CEDPFGFRIAAEHALFRVDPPLHYRADDFALVRHSNRRLEQSLQGELAETVVGRLHSSHEARDQRGTAASTRNGPRILFLQGRRVFRVKVMNLSALGIEIDQHHGAGKTHIRPADVDDFAERLATVVAAANVAALQAARRPITATPHSYVALGSPLL